jgi:hypothetical protein
VSVAGAKIVNDSAGLERGAANPLGRPIPAFTINWLQITIGSSLSSQLIAMLFGNFK